MNTKKGNDRREEEEEEEEQQQRFLVKDTSSFLKLPSIEESASTTSQFLLRAPGNIKLNQTSSVAIVLWCHGANREEMRKFALLNHRAYARKHNYDFIDGSAIIHAYAHFLTPFSWAKAVLLWQLLEGGTAYEYFMIADCDALYTRMDETINDLLKALKVNVDVAQVVVAGKYDNSPFNAGAILIRNSEWSRLFFTRVLRESENTVTRMHGWWENKAMIDLYERNEYEERLKISIAIENGTRFQAFAFDEENPYLDGVTFIWHQVNCPGHPAYVAKNIKECVRRLEFFFCKKFKDEDFAKSACDEESISESKNKEFAENVQRWLAEAKDQALSRETVLKALTQKDGLSLLLNATTAIAASTISPTSAERGTLKMFQGAGHIGEVPLEVIAYQKASKVNAIFHICEIGFNAGHSAIILLHMNPNKAKYTVFDIPHVKWGHRCAQFLSYLFPNRFTYIEGDSSITMRKFIDTIKEGKNKPCDLFSIDGRHSFEGAYEDFNNAKLASVPRGFILADDYTDSFPGVKRAWDLAKRENLIEEIECSGLVQRVNGFDKGWCYGRFISSS